MYLTKFTPVQTLTELDAIVSPRNEQENVHLSQYINGAILVV